MVKQALEAACGCPSENELAGLVESTLGEAERGRIMAHVEACTRCAGEVALLRAFLLAQPEGGDAAAVNWIAAQLERRSAELFHQPQRSRWLRLRAWLTPARLSAAAVALATVLLALSAVLHYRRAQEPVLTARLSPVQILRSGSVAVSEPQGDVDAPPSRLSWIPVREAASYEVRLMEVDNNVLWKGVSGAPVIELPLEIQQRAVPGKTLVWQVTALNAAGESLGSSGLVRFRVRVR